MRHRHLACMLALAPFCASLRHESLHSPPKDYVQLEAAPQDELLSLRIHLAELEKPYLKVAQQVSDPESNQYGRFLGAHELRAIVPDKGFISAKVTGWLEDEGLFNYTTSPDYVDVITAIADWNRVLNTTFYHFQHKATGRTMIRTTQYSIPSTQKDAIGYIYPTVHFFRSAPAPKTVQARQRVPTGASNCSNSVCPSQLRTQYNIHYSPADDKSGSTIAIAGFLNNFPNITDVKAFLTMYDKRNPKLIPSINVASVNKGTLKPPADGGSLTVEAELDLDYAMAFTGPLPVTFYSVGGHAPKIGQAPNAPISPDSNEPYAEFFDYVLGLKNPPKVISISYNDDEKDVPVAYEKHVCDLFAKAATHKAVSGYIKALHGKHKGFYNASGRAQPDISLLGDNYLTLTGGSPSTHDGTSASVPVFAAMIALVNDMRLRAKKPVLGFLNPLLYSAKASSVFRDVQDGSETTGCADGDFFETGWEALAGWDAATGLGEPDFTKLAAVLK
ncbi:tripeptidyl-peptidase 1 [Fusarium globosum]|uniref:Tripeptidyl-peptidase 1 n=1 Tax=Fusarium globosum TaxID=78864 RepID=A0A8H5YNG2_9HYPO|nr:tripeptidyl-peptidase 1 [Fusarium globosum]